LSAPKRVYVITVLYSVLRVACCKANVEGEGCTYYFEVPEQQTQKLL